MTIVRMAFATSCDGYRHPPANHGYSGATGDFDFFDNGATPLNPQDDRTRERQNNGYDRVSLLGRARVGRWTLGSRSSLQKQGLPGDSHDQALRASLGTAHQLFDAKFLKGLRG